jgi:hypothetical protein
MVVKKVGSGSLRLKLGSNSFSTKGSVGRVRQRQVEALKKFESRGRYLRRFVLLEQKEQSRTLTPKERRELIGLRTL